MKKVLVGAMFAFITMVPTAAPAASVCFTNGAKAVYAAGGKYTFSQDGGTWTGTWQGSPAVSGGSVTVKIDGGRTRHDRFETVNGRLYMISGNGGRFQVNRC